MAVFKILGTIVRIMAEGEERATVTKTYVRAETEGQAHLIANELGFVEAVVSYFCRNYEGNLGNESAYAADNNKGVLPGC